MKLSLAQDNYTKSLNTEVLECISFLYGQRLSLFSNPEVPWREIVRFEERLEAHIDALVIGGDEALEVCRQQAAEGDPGELYAAICVFCRQGRANLLIDVLETLDPEDMERQRAVADALKQELPIPWQNDFMELLTSDTPQLTDMIAELAGYRRLPVGLDLARLLQRKPTLPVIGAIGRLRERNAEGLITPLIGNDDKSIASAAALALLQMGDRNVVPQCLARVKGESWTHMPLALGGGPDVVEVLLEVARSAVTGDTLLALGILGESRGVDVLLERLEGDLAAPAAVALNLITGADLYERVFITEAVDEDELFPEELEAFRKEGKVPVKPDGTPYGEWVTRLARSREAWSDWWSANQPRFTLGMRYRYGRLYSPAALLETLEAEKVPHYVRQLAYEELVVRYDADFPFEPDMFVDGQMHVLNVMAQWVNANGCNFRDGIWYFAGVEMSG